MKEKIILALIFLVTVLILVNTDWTNRTVVYDCSLAEISPDYPQEVKNECRRLRLEEYKERQLPERKTTTI